MTPGIITVMETEAVSVRLSESECRVIRHALGLGPTTSSMLVYRNHYAAYRGSADYEVWTGLVKRGLALRNERNSQTLVLFHAGGDAARAVLQRGEGLDRETESDLSTVDVLIEEASRGKVLVAAGGAATSNIPAG